MSKTEAKYTWESFTYDSNDGVTFRSYLNSGNLLCRSMEDGETAIHAQKGDIKVEMARFDMDLEAPIEDRWTVWECVRDDTYPGTWEPLSTPRGRVIKFLSRSRAQRFATLMIEERV